MKFVIGVLLLLGLNTQAGLIDMSIGQKSINKLGSKIGDDCANYSGKWTGSCITGNKSENESVSIDQYGCNAWFLDSAPDFLYLNGKKVISDTDYSGPNAPYTREQLFETKWDGDKIIMIITEKNSMSSLPLFSSTGVFSLTQNSQVLSIVWNNSRSEHKVCTMNKK